ncbi:MAG: YkoF family thiamine/hydroxymethylpyrimidine-binding protein [Anaerolineae bacterium]
MHITIQVSAYPLGQSDYLPLIDEAIAALRGPGLDVSVGPLSTLVAGEEDVVWAALRRAFAAVARHGDVVLVATVTNACAGGPLADWEYRPK